MLFVCVMSQMSVADGSRFTDTSSEAPKFLKVLCLTIFLGLWLFLLLLATFPTTLFPSGELFMNMILIQPTANPFSGDLLWLSFFV